MVVDVPATPASPAGSAYALLAKYHLPRPTMQFLEPIDYKNAEFAEFYDELPLWSAPFGLMLLEQVPIRTAMTILDVGAGTGFLTIELAQRCGMASTVIAVDPWESATNRLKRKVEFLKLRNVTVLTEDVATVDLPDNSVDLIVSNLGINNFDNPQAAMSNCCRVAKPGATLCMTSNLVGHMSEFYDVFRCVLKELGLGGQLGLLDAHVNHRATVSSIRDQVQQAGFVFVEAITTSFRERFAGGTAFLRHYFIRLAFVQGWKALVPEGSVEQTFQVLEERLNGLAAAQCGLSLSIPAACVIARKPG